MNISESSRNILGRLSLPYTVVFWAIVTWYTITLGISRPKFGVVILGASVVAYTLSQMRDTMADENYLETGLLLFILGYTVLMTGYILAIFDTLFFVRVGYALWYEYLMAALMILIIIYLTYREFGLAFTGVVFGVIIYARWGNYFPGLLNHGGFSWERIILASSLDFAGIYGSLTQLVAAWIAMLMLFAGLFRAYGAFDVIKRIAARARTYSRSGAAQSAVIASLIIGMITGAAIANAAMTGSFTIPLMKKDGIKAKTAAGVEAVASAGGQIMPPVMAATAFVMAALLSISYVEVLVAGLVPALVFYVSVASGVHYRAISQRETPEDVDQIEDEPDHPLFNQELKTRRDLFADAIKFGTPFLILIWALGIARLTVSTAGLYASIAMVVFGVGVPVVQSALEGNGLKGPFLKGLQQTIDGLEYGLRLFAPIMIIVAVVNGIVDLLNATGMPGVFSLYILQLAGGIMLFGIVLAMLICIILGMGMPTVAAYTIVALLVAPTLTGEYGIPVLAAHFFVFYSAMLSGITPPIAMNVIVTTGIAESDFWASAFEAVRIAITLFVLPFAFVYNPEIITEPFAVQTLYSSVLLMVGAICLVHALNYNVNEMNRLFSYALRGIYAALGIIAMVYPGEIVRTAAAVGFVILLFGQRAKWGIHQPRPRLVERPQVRE
ncbi:TRAP transporter fused permease subunit [Haloferax sp. AB510]|uniref:TRAP transporter permease n=1 Tax=Haloferax sp. AB510 TaxID=2934172 RepID=UPI00209C04D7|nr:TRAP transporter fused permease subunit [Haloferax sp. AB510]MCO8267152.1 TRAP transporter fused permease subunit [Haloferax sp. AB510]